RLKEQVEVSLGKTSAFCKGRRNIALRGIERIGDNVLVAHGAFLGLIFFLGHRTPGNGNFERSDRVKRLAKCKLNRPTNLSQAEPFITSSPVERTPPKVRTS